MIVNNIAIEIEGVDKAGKDQLLQYICIVGNYKYTLNARGILSNLTYANVYNRDYEYVLSYKPLIIFLDVETEDHACRCAITHEPDRNFEEDRQKFLDNILLLGSKGIIIWKYNTTQMTTYQIAKDIVKRLESINPNDFVLAEPIKLYGGENG